MTNALSCISLRTILVDRAISRHVATMNDGREYDVLAYPGAWRGWQVTIEKDGREISRYAARRVFETISAKVEEMGFLSPKSLLTGAPQ